MIPKGKTVLTLAEVAEYLRIPTSTIYKLSREGAIPAQKLGKQWRYHKDVLDDWLKGKMLTKTAN
jgi:excisionase family DNA binding protein